MAAFLFITVCSEMCRRGDGKLGCLCGKAGTNHLCNGSAHSSGCVVNGYCVLFGFSVCVCVCSLFRDTECKAIFIHCIYTAQLSERRCFTRVCEFTDWPIQGDHQTSDGMLTTCKVFCVHLVCNSLYIYTHIPTNNTLLHYKSVLLVHLIWFAILVYYMCVTTASRVLWVFLTIACEYNVVVQYGIENVL